MVALGWVLMAWALFSWCPEIPALAFSCIVIRWTWLLTRGMFQI